MMFFYIYIYIMVLYSDFILVHSVFGLFCVFLFFKKWPTVWYFCLLEWFHGFSGC